MKVFLERYITPKVFVKQKFENVEETVNLLKGAGKISIQEDGIVFYLYKDEDRRTYKQVYALDYDSNCKTVNRLFLNKFKEVV